MFVAICDGACSGNPGPASIGVVIWERFKASDAQKKAPTKVIRKHIGVATNNDAEWKAILEALSYCKSHAERDHIFLYTDSQLVTFQAQGKWKIKEPRMREYKAQFDAFVRHAESRGQEVHIAWVPRQMTFLADKQADLALREEREHECPHEGIGGFVIP